MIDRASVHPFPEGAAVPDGTNAEPGIKRFGRGFWNWHLSRRLIVMTTALLVMLHLCNIMVVAYFYSLSADREREAREATATLLAEHTSRAFAAVDLSLDVIADTLMANPDLPPARIQSLLNNRIKRLPQIRTLFIADENGTTTYSTSSFPARPIALGDRPYFSELKKSPTLDSYIGARMISRGDGSTTFTISRPLRDNAGQFHGIVAALAAPFFFSSFYGAGELVHDEAAVLFRSDGKVLAGTGLNNATTPLDARIDDVLATRTGIASTTRDVPSYALKILVAGPSPWRSPAFLTFLITDGFGIAAMTAIAFWLTGILRREAKARDKAETRLSDAFENAPAGFALFDAADRLVLCNNVFRSHYPAPLREELVPGAPYERLLRAAAEASHNADINDAATLDRYIEERLAAHQASNDELVRQHQDGAWVLIRERHTSDGGTVVFETDISAMKQQEEALRHSEQAERVAREQAENASRAKSSFLATMSHELRTPLNAVIGFSEIIETQLFGSNPERYRDYGGLIRRSGHHLLAIINDILDIAKLQSGKTELHIEPTSIAGIIDETLRLVQNQAEAANLLLDHEIEGDLPMVRADATRLRQVLLNLLSNAIKFTPGGGRISITAHGIDGGVRIDVSDTGIGIAATDIPRALEPFGQVSNAMTRTHEGTGLGLPLSKSLIELHGAHFGIASALGSGTTVSIIFPVELTVADDGAASASAGAMAVKRRRAR